MGALNILTKSFASSEKKQYSRGKFNNEPTGEATHKDRIQQPERLVGSLTLENEFLKKGHLYYPLSANRACSLA
jgi:hypothetical protein